MKLRCTLITVSDMERAKDFYCGLFGLEMLVDNDGNMLLSDGLALQDKEIWKSFTGRETDGESCKSELYFEEEDIEGFVKKLEEFYPDVKYVNALMTHSWGQRVVRFFDPDGNLIEVGTPV